MSKPNSKHIFLAFDAFGTLFTPRKPIAAQYGEIARKHGIGGFGEDELMQSFKNAFKEEAKQHPNFGKRVDMKAPEWWANIITKTFMPFLNSKSLPPQLVPDLLTRFSTSEGYSLYPDVLPFFETLRAVKKTSDHAAWPWKTSVGVITNSDDRIPCILKSFGLKVSDTRIGHSPREPETDHDIDFVVLSYDAGVEKPDQRIFEAAEQLFWKKTTEKCEPSERNENHEFWFVGDDVEKDAEGARDAGWNAVHLDREGEGRHVEVAKEGKPRRFQIGDLGDLRRCIEHR